MYVEWVQKGAEFLNPASHVSVNDIPKQDTLLSMNRTFMEKETIGENISIMYFFQSWAIQKYFDEPLLR